MYQNHLVRSIKWSSDQLHFDSCACSLHAFCMHTCQDWVSQNWIDFDEECFAHTSSECLAIINWHLHADFYHEVQNVCQLSRLCALHAISKSKWYVDYQTPYPMQGFLWKGGSSKQIWCFLVLYCMCILVWSWYKCAVWGHNFVHFECSWPSLFSLFSGSMLIVFVIKFRSHSNWGWTVI